MADSNTTAFQASPVDLAQGVGENSTTETNPLDVSQMTSEQLAQRSFDPEGYQQKVQGNQAESLLNAARPTPLGNYTNPSVSNTLSNLGTIEPQQVAAASQALAPQAPEQALAPQSVPVQPLPTSIPDSTAKGLSGPPAPTDQEKLDQNFQHMKGIELSYAKAASDKNIADQAQYKEQEKTILKAEQESAAAKAKFDTDYQVKMTSYQKSVDEYKEAAGEKVLPGRILADQTTSQKLQTGIAMALSAYGGALSGQDSMAMKVINTAIENDINAQKFNIENKLKSARVGIDASQYIFTQMKDKFRDDEAAVIASKNAMLELTKTRIMGAATKFDTAGITAKAQQAVGAINNQQLQLQMALKEKMANLALLNTFDGKSSSPVAGVQSGDESAPRTLSGAQLSVMKDSANKVVSNRADSYIPGYGTSPSGETARKDALEYLKERGPLLKDFDRISELQQDYNKATDQAKRRQIETVMTAMKAKLKKGALLETNRFSPELMDFIKEFTGSPNDYLTNDKWQKQRFEEARSSIVRDVNGRMQDLGYPSYKSDFKSNSYEQLQAARNKK